MNLAPEVMKEVFEIEEFPYAFWNDHKLKPRKIPSVKHGIDTAFFAGARIWNILPSHLKECQSLELFESKIKKKRISENRLCKLCKLISNRSASYKLWTKCLTITVVFFFLMSIRFKGGSTFHLRMWFFVTIVYDW